MALLPQDPAGGWNTSAGAWIRFVDEGDVNRTHLLDPIILDLAGEVQGRRVLDIGCGEGRFCRLLKTCGAETVGIDSTHQLLEEARQRDPTGSYQIADAVNLPFPDAGFDLCVSYVALVDIQDYRRAIAEMARVLKPGGHVVFSNLQSYVTCNMKGWSRDSGGRKIYFPIDHYATERELIGKWCDIEVMQYHRPLAEIMQAFLKTELTLRHFLEPVPDAEAIRAHAILADQARVPLFIVMKWLKPPQGA